MYTRKTIKRYLQYADASYYKFTVSCAYQNNHCYGAFAVTNASVLNKIIAYFRRLQNMRIRIMLLLICSLFVLPCFSQLVVHENSFKETDCGHLYDFRDVSFGPNEKTIIEINVINSKDCSISNSLVFNINIPKSIYIKSSKDVCYLLIDSKATSLMITYPCVMVTNDESNDDIKEFDICELNYDFPVALESGKCYTMNLYDLGDDALIIVGSNIVFKQENEKDESNSHIVYYPKYIMGRFGKSYNVALFDKHGNQYTTGLYVSMANRSYVRVQKYGNSYEQYVLKESDKEEYTFMTIGESEIEPLYIK